MIIKDEENWHREVLGEINIQNEANKQCENKYKRKKTQLKLKIDRIDELKKLNFSGEGYIDLNTYKSSQRRNYSSNCIKNIRFRQWKWWKYSD